MRLGFNGLSGIVTNRMGMNLRDGDVFVFVNAARGDFRAKAPRKPMIISE